MLEALAPWCFALDRTNYARWLPVHIKDMKTLPPAIKDQSIAGPEQARILDEFEEMNNMSEEPAFQSHEQGHATQETFHKQVSNRPMCDAIESMGNPFLNTAKEHTVLDTHDCMDEQVVEVLYKIEQLGKQ